MAHPVDPSVSPPPAREPVVSGVGTLGVLWRGLFIGAADIVPGVSGGTMALVLGIYDRLLTALASLTRAPVWAALRRGRWALAWRSVDATFLLALVAGIAVSVIGLAGVIELALETYRPQVYALFAGLIVASVPVVLAEVPRWRAAEVVALVAAAAAAALLVGLAPMAMPTGTLFLVLAGAIGICALVLPGVSGAFLLVILGQYETVIGAIARGDLRVLAPFALGAAVGLLAFTRLLGGWLRRFPGPTHAVLAGFLVGSLRRVWPWQPEDALRLELLPPPDLGAALVGAALALAGAAAVLALTWAGRRRR